MPTYSERLNEALERSGRTKTQFAEAMGVSYQAISKALSGDTKALTAANNQKAANFLGVCAAWLATGEGERENPAAGLGSLSQEEVELLRLLRALPENVRAEAFAAAHQVASAYANRVATLLTRSGA